MKVTAYIKDLEGGDGSGYEKMIVVNGYKYQHTYDPNGFMDFHQYYIIPLDGRLVHHDNQGSPVHSQEVFTPSPEWEQVESHCDEEWVRNWCIDA